MTTKKTARKYSSPVIGELLHEINFTVDILTEIAMALNLTLSDFFTPKQVQVVNKINLVFNVKVQESSIKYVTPLGDIVNSNETFYNPWQIQSFPHLLTSLKA